MLHDRNVWSSSIKCQNAGAMNHSTAVTLLAATETLTQTETAFISKFSIRLVSFRFSHWMKLISKVIGVIYAYLQSSLAIPQTFFVKVPQ